MGPSANFNTLSNIVFQTKSAQLKYSTLVIQSEIFPVPHSTDDWDK